jgi:hypothetical protein
MSILTDRELEFLAGLNRSWSRLYWNELALLLTVQPGDVAGACDAAGPYLALPLAADGGGFFANSTSAESAPTPALLGKRGRGSLAAQAVTASSSIE